MAPKRLRQVPYNPGVRDLVASKRAVSRPLPQAAIDQGFLGWHENGYLPHRDEPGLVQFVTFRLADAFPNELRHEWESLLRIEDDRKRRMELEAYLDKGRGKCDLRQTAIAKLVEDSLVRFHSARYDLRAWVVMPNHVHVLFQVLDMPMWKLVGGWKSYTTREANKLLGRKSKFWQDGYWDTFMRNEEHELRSRRYTEKNPVKAGLVSSARDWTWGSARRRDAYERLCFPES
jgi:REP element-mobilizing transposase RayT